MARKIIQKDATPILYYPNIIEKILCRIAWHGWREKGLLRWQCYRCNKIKVKAPRLPDIPQEGLFETDQEYQARVRAILADKHYAETKHYIESFGKRIPDKATGGETGEFCKWYKCKDCGFETDKIFIKYPSLAEIHAKAIYTGKCLILNYIP